MQKIKLVIEYDIKEKRINVSGPLQDRVLCKGMIGEAIRIIDTRAEPTQQSNIVVPEMRLVPKQ